MRPESPSRGSAPPLTFVALIAAPCVVARAADAQDAPILKILDQFTARSVPTSGPSEPGPTARNWLDPTTNPSAINLTLPGNGIAQHPMLYAGEGFNALFLVKSSKVILST